MRAVVGIDLGTTHTAVATLDLDAPGALPLVSSTPQLVARGQLEERALLPSFVYFAHEGEGALALPWDESRRYCVGELARARAVEAPARVISSAKSWLCHPGVDRRGPLLPSAAADDVEKISPVEASFRLLDHIVEAWQTTHPEALSSHPVILTVPASFDAAARDLTVEAAYAAGLEDVTLLEEPQAALYAWIATQGERFRKHLSPGDVVLVVDIGGGTTDFSAIACREQGGALTLERIAVGDHILLGGDNMDLALAHLLAGKLSAQGKTLDRFQLASLAHACRAAKEQVLSPAAPERVAIAIAGRGSALLGNTLRTELTRAEVEASLLDGFFPAVARDARPAARARVGLTQLGLPYAADPAITKHLAAFLTRQSDALADGRPLLRPTAVLFNGGVVKSTVVRERLLSALNGWLVADGAPPVRVLPGEDPELAVARGAAFYGRVQGGHALKIVSATARAYYVGIESPAPAVPGVEPPIAAFCVAPFGMDEGTAAELPPHELGVIVGEPVQFRFFGSSVRRSDAAGALLEQWPEGELEELCPIEVTLPAEGRAEGDVVPVRLHAAITPVGTLLLEALPLEPLSDAERWKLELGVRSAS
ncbi:MAG: Hsp70 family protein [Polyangiaceae bacterium]|nr:Hsp70 family protein [Polyangiaceae bacterium]